MICEICLHDIRYHLRGCPEDEILELTDEQIDDLESRAADLREGDSDGRHRA